MMVPPQAAADRASTYDLLPFITIAALGAGFLVVFRQRAAARRVARERRPMHAAITGSRGREPSPAERPWWGSPWLWVAVCAVTEVTRPNSSWSTYSQCGNMSMTMPPPSSRR